MNQQGVLGEPSFRVDNKRSRGSTGAGAGRNGSHEDDGPAKLLPSRNTSNSNKSSNHPIETNLSSNITSSSEQNKLTANTGVANEKEDCDGDDLDDWLDSVIE